jgi:HK97 family phage prohead protease
MKTAVYDVTEVKATTEGPKGLFAARVSVFGNVDRNGDRVMPKAFDGTLERWRASGRNIPVIWSHEHKEPDAYIGEVDPADVSVTEDGLVVAGRLFIDANPRAAQVYELLSKGLVHSWSFAYEVKDERVADDLAREILEAEIFEIGPTLIGANPNAQTLMVAEAPMTEDKAPDESAWDGNRAMTQASTATEYRQICAGERSEGEPDERAHWALPHHYVGRDANTAGVRNALARLPQTQGLKNREAAQGHLERHLASARTEAASADAVVTSAIEAFNTRIDALVEEKIGRVLSAKTEAKIRAALVELQTILGSLGEETAPPEQDDAPPPDVKEPSRPVESLHLRRQHELSDVGLFLAERGH